MNKTKFSTLFLIGLAIILSGCPSPEIILSGENTLTEITVNDGTKDMVGSIAASNITFSDSAAAGTSQVTVKAIQFSEKASANAQKNDTIPINKTITITAENGSTKNYAMSINVRTATTTGTGMTMTGNPVAGTITGVRLAVDTILASGVVLSGSFTKLNNPFITEMGILVTTDARLNLELTSDNEALTGVTKYATETALLQRINNPVNTDITFPFTLSNLRYGAPHSFRYYAIINGAVVYSNILRASTLVSYIPIPDDNFRNAILSCINTNGMTTISGQLIATETRCEESFEGMISASGNSIRTAALVSITQFNYGVFANKTDAIKIRSLSGLEQMVNLTRLNLRANLLSGSSLDVSRNIALTSLRVLQNSLSNVDVSKNTALTDLHVTSNSLTSIDVSKNIALTNLNVASNSLTSIDVSKNTALTELDVNNNNSLSSIDVSKNTALTILNAGLISLRSIDVSKNTALTELYVNNNSLTSIDVSKNTALTNLFVNTNHLSSLDVSKNTALNRLNTDMNISLTCILVNASQLMGINFVGFQRLSTSCP